MTPKEKAEELVKKFANRWWLSDLEPQRLLTYDEKRKLYNRYSIGCAIIAVDELIESNPTSRKIEHLNGAGYITNIQCSKEYWEEVKNELIKLL